MFWFLIQMITIVTPLIAGVCYLMRSDYVTMAICFCCAISLIAVYLLIELKIICEDMEKKK